MDVSSIGSREEGVECPATVVLSSFPVVLARTRFQHSSFFLGIGDTGGEERASLRSALLHGGSEGSERCSSPVTLCGHLPHCQPGRPSLRTPLGVIPVVSGPAPSLRDCAASDQGPGQDTVLTGSSLHGGSQCDENRQPARTAASAALGTPPTCQPGTCTDYVPAWRC